MRVGVLDGVGPVHEEVAASSTARPTTAAGMVQQKVRRWQVSQGCLVQAHFGKAALQDYGRSARGECAGQTYVPLLLSRSLTSTLPSTKLKSACRSLTVGSGMHTSTLLPRPAMQRALAWKDTVNMRGPLHGRPRACRKSLSLIYGGCER